MLSKDYWRYWAKADTGVEGANKWHPFAYHSLDAAVVAATFWRDSSAVRRTLMAAFDVEEAEIQRLLAWILFFVALHDIGKLHALFQIKAPHILPQIWPDLASTKLIDTSGGHYDHGREGYRLSMAELRGWFKPASRHALKAWSSWLAAVTGHHGEIPDNDDPLPAYAEATILEQDANARRAWIQEAADLFLHPAGLTLEDPPPPCVTEARNLLAGFCSLCDWIGSNVDVFAYAPPALSPNDYLHSRLEQIRRDDILRHFGLIATPLAYQGIPALLKADEHPRGTQIMIDDLPLAPGLTIVEAPTGSGKTEAALAYAWRLIDAGLAESIVFALPTQATANAMLGRCETFSKSAFGRANLVLAHGHSRLNQAYQRLIEAGSKRTAQGETEAGVQCAAWLASSRKRVFLGQIGVCTVDQVLLSVLPVRHNFVRAFGLHRSVLIVDEVHAYDAYMNGLLIEVLKRQKAVGGSAILLSATLPAGIRGKLLESWGHEPVADVANYPAIWNTAALSESGSPLSLPDTERPAQRTIEVSLSKLVSARPDEPLIQRIIDAAESGALVGIVMNTVDDAQQLWIQLHKNAQVPVDLFHARFRLQDRQRIEQRVIEHYGREAERTQGRILVATQVIEQSLDLDFDWLITQLCPVDLLFQRLGRLHRHSRKRPDDFQVPACTVLSVETDDYGLHELIYGDARLLWRTEFLLARHRQIHFPAAYREWIEPVYGEAPWDDEPESVYGKHLAWRDDQIEAEKKAHRLTTMNLSKFRDDEERLTSLTRDGEMSLSVLLIREDGRLLDGEDPDQMDEYTQAETLMLNTVPAPHSWGDRQLAGHVRDEDGRIRLTMHDDGQQRWSSLDGGVCYTTELGLAKAETAGLMDPPTVAPR